MTNEQKVNPEQVVRVRETFECHGVRLPKGSIGYVWEGENYGVLGKDEVAVSFTFMKERDFIGVPRDKIEPFEGDIVLMVARAKGYEKLEFRLREIQQRWIDRGSARMANVVLEMRKAFHVKCTTSLLGWNTQEAEADFMVGEAQLKLIGAKPYQVNADVTKVN